VSAYGIFVTYNKFFFLIDFFLFQQFVAKFQKLVAKAPGHVAKFLFDFLAKFKFNEKGDFGGSPIPEVNV
jgi:hypothetical protein